MATKQKKDSLSFDIGQVEYDENMKEYKPVLLDKKVIFKIYQETYMGFKANYTNDVIAILSKKLKYEVTKEDLQRAITFGTIPTKKP